MLLDRGVMRGWTWPPACKPSNITFQRGVLFVGPSSAPVHRKVWAKKAGAPGVRQNDPPSSWITAVKTIQQPQRCPGVTAQQAQSPTLVLQPPTPQDSLSMPLFACSLFPIQLIALCLPRLHSTLESFMCPQHLLARTSRAPL